MARGTTRPKVARRIRGEGEVYRALNDDTRRAILRLLAQREWTAGALAEAFPDISRPAVSKHLRVLREAGLAQERAAGRERWYSLRYDPLRDVVGYVLELERFWETSLERLGDHLGSSDLPRKDEAP